MVRANHENKEHEIYSTVNNNINNYYQSLHSKSFLLSVGKVSKRETTPHYTNAQ